MTGAHASPLQMPNSKRTSIHHATISSSRLCWEKANMRSLSCTEAACSANLLVNVQCLRLSFAIFAKFAPHQRTKLGSAPAQSAPLLPLAREQICPQGQWSSAPVASSGLWSPCPAHTEATRFLTCWVRGLLLYAAWKPPTPYPLPRLD